MHIKDKDNLIFVNISFPHMNELKFKNYKLYINYNILVLTPHCYNCTLKVHQNSLEIQ